MREKIKSVGNWLGTGSINVFGVPFAGKDTQCNELAGMLNGKVISGGDVLRHAKQNEQVQRLMSQGEIIPSELFEQIVLPYLSNPEFSSMPLILSEVGRMWGEHEVILKATEQSGHPTKAVILIKLKDDEVYGRFRESQQTHDRGERADDNADVLKTRLDSYHQKVTPVIDYYRETGLLDEVDGSLPREAVTEQIINKLAARAGA